MTRLVLASASPGRRQVLRGAGIDPAVLVSGVDEDAVIAAIGESAPESVTTALAVAKADAVVEHLDPAVAADCVVIGCDSMLLLGGRLCGKPGTAQQAAAQWEQMAGQQGNLLTGHSILRLSEGAVVHRDSRCRSTVVQFGTPSPADLAAYIGSGEPLAVAGAFTLDGLGGWFIERIDGDPSNVIGISLPLLTSMLIAAGVSVAELWASNPLPHN